jgi:hypothetical protein
VGADAVTTGWVALFAPVSLTGFFIIFFFFPHLFTGFAFHLLLSSGVHGRAGTTGDLAGSERAQVWCCLAARVGFCVLPLIFTGLCAMIPDWVASRVLFCCIAPYTIFRCCVWDELGGMKMEWQGRDDGGRGQQYRLYLST